MMRAKDMNNRTMVYDHLPVELRQILDRACHAAYRSGYNEGYQDGKSGVEDHTQSEEEKQTLELTGGKEWKEKEAIPENADNINKN